MLLLESDRWASLGTAYGNGVPVAKWLEQLTKEPENAGKRWHEFDYYGYLCHQETVYTASYAAVPHLVNLTKRLPDGQRDRLNIEILVFIGDIAGNSSRDGVWLPNYEPKRFQAAPIPVDLLADYQEALAKAQMLILEKIKQPGLSRTDFIFLLRAACSFQKDNLWFQELDRLAGGELTGICPHCEMELFLVIGEHGFFAAAEEWVQTDSTGTIAVRPDINRHSIEPTTGDLPEMGKWLFEQACSAQQNEVAHWILHVFGTTTCPLCGCRLDVHDAIGWPGPPKKLLLT